MVLHNLLPSSDCPEYLFKSSGSAIVFLELQEAMQSLNDYCVLCDRAATDQLRNWKNRLSIAETELDDAEEDDMGAAAQAWDAQVGVENWVVIQEIVVAGMILVLLSTFVEKELKRLCVLGDKVAAKGIRKNGRSYSDVHIEFLRSHLGLRFQEPIESIEARERAREMRNHFAHGDWSEFRNKLDSLDLSRAFRATSSLFREIEIANSNGPRIDCI